MAKHLAGLLTEPMTIRQLASEWFKVNRNTMSAILKRIDGTERCGRLVRVPVAKMKANPRINCFVVQDPVDGTPVQGLLGFNVLNVIQQIRQSPAVAAVVCARSVNLVTK
jgi:hypothetical protein